MLGCVVIWAGACGVAVGEPEDAHGHRPMWFKAGLVAAAGLIAGVLLNVGLSEEQ
jgi:hypothetical protein